MKRRCNLFTISCFVAVFIGEACMAADDKSSTKAQATIRARVVDKRTGQPIEGASVGVRSNDSPSSYLPQSLESTQPHDLPASHTDDRGLAKCEPLPAGRHAIEVWGDGYVKQWKEFLVGGGAFKAEIEFRLSPAVSIEGAVRDAAGAPLAARVTFHVESADFDEAIVGDAEGTPRSVRVAYYAPFADWGQDAASVAETDANGNYRLPSVPIDADIALMAWSIGPGYLFGNRDLRTSADAATRIDFALERRPPGASIRGLVVDESGAPIAGASIKAVYFNRPVYRPRDPVETTTAADGRFRLEDLVGGVALLETSAPGFARVFSRVPLGPQAAADEARIVLKPGRLLRARVVDERNAPLPEVAVYMAANGGPSSLLGGTDHEGHFEANVPETSRFTFSKAEYSTLWARQLELDPAKETIIAMQRSGVIRAKVVGAPDGRPVQEFVLGRGAGRPLHVYSGDGSFELDESWRNARVVDAQGYLRRVLLAMSPAAPGEGQSIEVGLEVDDPATYVRFGGQVMDDSGSHVADVQLRLLCAVDCPDSNDDVQIINRFDSIVKGHATHHDRIARCESATSDQQGRFAFAVAPRTSHVFIVWWKEGIAPGKLVKLEQLSDAAAGQLELRAAPPAGITLHIDRQAFPDADELSLFSASHDPIVELGPKLRLGLDPALDSFEIHDLAEGSYQVQLLGGERGSRVLARRGFSLGRGEKTRVDLTAEDRPRPRNR